MDIYNSFKLSRLETNYHSLDMAVRDDISKQLGLPIPISIEIYGNPGCGKTTLAYALASKVATSNDIYVADFEGVNELLLRSVLGQNNFTGSVYINGGGQLQQEASDENILTYVADKIADKNTQAIIIDSVGAISPIAEREQQELGGANMGRRAMLMAQFSRRVTKHLRNRSDPLLAILINHIHAKIGGFGVVTPGGDTLKYLSRVRIQVSKGTTYTDGSFTIKGKVKKNNFGLEGETFEVFNLAGVGIHQGLSDLNDCINLGLVEERRGRIILGEENFGYRKTLIEKAMYSDGSEYKVFADLLQHRKMEWKQINMPQ